MTREGSGPAHQCKDLRGLPARSRMGPGIRRNDILREGRTVHQHSPGWFSPPSALLQHDAAGSREQTALTSLLQAPKLCPSCREGKTGLRQPYRLEVVAATLYPAAKPKKPLRLVCTFQGIIQATHRPALRSRSRKQVKCQGYPEYGGR